MSLSSRKTNKSDDFYLKLNQGPALNCSSSGADQSDRGLFTETTLQPSLWAAFLQLHSADQVKLSSPKC